MELRDLFSLFFAASTSCVAAWFSACAWTKVACSSLRCSVAYRLLFATLSPPLLLLCVLTRFNREAVRILKRTEKAENAAQMSEPTLTKNKWKTPKNEKRTSATALSRALISACVRYWSDCATIISDENAWNNARVPVPLELIIITLKKRAQCHRIPGVDVRSLTLISNY